MPVQLGKRERNSDSLIISVPQLALTYMSFYKVWALKGTEKKEINPFDKYNFSKKRGWSDTDGR